MIALRHAQEARREHLGHELELLGFRIERRDRLRRWNDKPVLIRDSGFQGRLQVSSSQIIHLTSRSTARNPLADELPEGAQLAVRCEEALGNDLVQVVGHVEKERARAFLPLEIVGPRVGGGDALGREREAAAALRSCALFEVTGSFGSALAQGVHVGA